MKLKWYNHIKVYLKFLFLYLKHRGNSRNIYNETVRERDRLQRKLKWKEKGGVITNDQI